MISRTVLRMLVCAVVYGQIVMYSYYAFQGGTVKIHSFFGGVKTLGKPHFYKPL